MVFISWDDIRYWRALQSKHGRSRAKSIPPSVFACHSEMVTSLLGLSTNITLKEILIWQLLLVTKYNWNFTFQHIHNGSCILLQKYFSLYVDYIGNLRNFITLVFLVHYLLNRRFTKILLRYERKITDWEAYICILQN